MQIFYTPDIKKTTYQLSAEESKHCIKVLRVKADDKVCMVDGKGGLYYGIVDKPDAKATIIRVIEKIEHYGQRNYNLHIAIAPTKNIERLEWFLEKATEIGIDEITPLLCQRSERKVIKAERLDRIIISAMKQSIKAYQPVLNPLTRFSKFVEQQNLGDTFIAHCMDTPKLAFKSQITDSKNITILIGPEGDFSSEEIELALKNNFKETHLGKSRLRTETAGIVACNTVNLIKNE